MTNDDTSQRSWRRTSSGKLAERSEAITTRGKQLQMTKKTITNDGLQMTTRRIENG